MSFQPFERGHDRDLAHWDEPFPKSIHLNGEDGQDGRVLEEHGAAEIIL
ncbi:hypothetical protein [Komagataeibacter sucrofermentans]